METKERQKAYLAPISVRCLGQPGVHLNESVRCLNNEYGRIIFLPNLRFVLEIFAREGRKYNLSGPFREKTIRSMFENHGGHTTVEGVKQQGLWLICVIYSEKEGYFEFYSLFGW